MGGRCSVTSAATWSIRGSGRRRAPAALADSADMRVRSVRFSLAGKNAGWVPEGLSITSDSWQQLRDMKERLQLRCSTCGAANPPQAKFCARCGARLGTAGPQTCLACGSVVVAGARFCEACGARLPTSPIVSHRRRKLLAVLAGLALILTSVVVLLVFGRLSLLSSDLDALRVPTPLSQLGFVAVGSQASDLKLDRTGTRAYVADSKGGYIAIVDLLGPTVIDRIGVPQGVEHFVVTRNAKLAYAVYSGRPYLSVVDFGTRSIEAFELAGLPTSVALNPDETMLFLALAGQSPVVEARDVRQRANVWVRSFGGNTATVSLSHDGRLLYVVNDAGNEVWAVDVESGHGRRREEYQRPWNILESPDGKFLAVASPIGKVSILDTATLVEMRNWTLARPMALAFSRAGRHLYVGALNGSGITEIRLSDGKITRRMDYPGSIFSMEVGPENSLLYVANFDTGHVDIVKLR